MSVEYGKLFDILKERNIKNTAFIKEAGFSANILTRLRRNEYVSLESIETICKTLDLEPSEILEFK